MTNKSQNNTPKPSVLKPKSSSVKPSVLTPKSSSVKSSALTPKSSSVKSSVLKPKSSNLTPKSSSTESSALTPKSSSVKPSALTPKSSSVKSSVLTPKSSSVKSSALTPKSSSVKSSVLKPKSSSVNSSIFIAGHKGMVGAAIVRQLLKNGHRPESLVLRTHKELDLTNQAAVNDFFKNEKIDHIALAAAKVGGIHANNTYPADFIYTNLMIQCNIIHGAYKAGIEHLLFLGSSCIYPKHAPQPMKEEYLLTGELEPTNEPYAVAKIAGIKMCESYNRQYGTSYRSVMPTNLYGPGDNYHLENSHVIPAMIRKFHLAKLAMQGDLKAIQQDEKIYGPIPKDIKEAIGLNSQSSSLSPQSSKNARVLIWGTGKSYREFLHVDDMASACLHIMNLDQYVFTANPDTPQSSVLNPQSPNLTPQSSNPNPKSSALNPKSSNLSPKSSALPPQSSVLSPKSSSVESSALSPQSSNLTPKSSSIESSFLNIGTGHDQTIADTAQIIKKVVGFDGEVVWDTSKPDGTPRKLLNTSQINALHWKPAWSLEDGLQNAYDDYKRQLLPQ